MPGNIRFETVDARLRATRSMWIATVGDDQKPHLVPLWFYWDGRAIYFNTGRTTIKQRNLSTNKRVAAHLGDGDDPVIVEGIAEMVTDAGEIGGVNQAYQVKYVDPHSGAAAGYPETAEDIPYRIEIDRIMAWAYGTVITRTDFRFDGKTWRGSAPPRI